MMISSQSTPGRFGAVAIFAAIVGLGGGCKDKGAWLYGQWLLVEEGKPGACHEFKKDDLYDVYVGSDCKGPTDPGLCGKWQMKGEDRFAIRRGKEIKAHLVVISDRDKDQLSVRGGMNGTFYKVGEKGATALISELEDKGALKVRALPSELGCKALGRPMDEIKKLPAEPKPRMIRARDEGLEYHVERNTGDPMVEKIVYAVNLDQLDWLSFQLTAAAFAAPGPQARFTDAIGNPSDTAATGSGASRQVIAMWKAYCKKVAGVSGRDVDVTLFATPGKNDGYFYVSENVISNTWAELKSAADDPTQQADEEEQEEGGQAAAAPPPAPPPAAPPPPAAKSTPAAVAKPPPPPPPSPPAARPPKGKPGQLAVPGSDDEI